MSQWTADSLTVRPNRLALARYAPSQLPARPWAGERLECARFARRRRSPRVTDSPARR